MARTDQMNFKILIWSFIVELVQANRRWIISHIICE